jgi:Na+-translocating ferredoxin:NAD+ oxidoreductase subunit G
MTNPSPNKDSKPSKTNTVNSNQQMKMTGVKIAVSKNSLILALFALVSTGLIAITYQLTKQKIAKQVELALIRQLSEIVPSENYNNNVYNDCLLVTSASHLGSSGSEKLYRMRQDNQAYALMVTSIAPDGYSGKIKLAIAADVDGKLLGVNILSHNETPGLGDKIERNKSDWINQFKGLSLNSPVKKQWAVKKDGGQFDALTGATITPRAVIKSVYKGLQFFQQNQAELFAKSSDCYQHEVD